MIDLNVFFPCLAVMSIVTYLVRMLPFLLIRKKIKSRFIISFFHYIPYTVIAAMTVPAVFYSTSAVSAAVAGFICAVVLAFFKRGLLTVAAGACAAVFIAELFI